MFECLHVLFEYVDNMVTEEQYHIEFKPPPEGSMTGFGNKDVVQPVSDLHHDQDQVQKRYAKMNVLLSTLSFLFST